MIPGALERLTRQGEFENYMERRAEKIKERAQQLAPRKTGTLADSIDVEPDGEGGFTVGTDVDYALDQEFGTINTPEHAFLRPAIDAARD